MRTTTVNVVRLELGNMKERYALGSIILHWAMVILILALIGLGWYMVGIPRGTPPRAYFFNLHKSIGLISGVFIALFIGWRLRYVPPPHPDTMARWEMKLAVLAHRLIYFFLILVLVSGYVEANFTQYGIKFFGYPLPPWGPNDKRIDTVLVNVHDYSADAFAVLIAIHVGAAIKHFLVNRDRILQRMLPFG
jgi:cytochrome b561